MGYWTTLHLFDDEIFYKKVVPELKGEKGDLKLDCLEFLSSHITGGIAHLSETEITKLLQNFITNVNKISNSFDKTFKLHNEFYKIDSEDERSVFLDKLEGHYDYCKFFEYYVFKTCADFFPYIPLGKGGVFRNFDLKYKTLAYSIILELDSINEFHNEDRMGITNWITNEDIEFLYLDKENLNFEDNETANTFMTLLEIAHQNKLGMVMGIDMREWRLELLPQNKLVNPSIWGNIDKKWLKFQR